MQYSKDAIQFSNQLVSNYATYDVSQKRYVLPITQIPEFDIHEFSSILLKDDNLANEANGCDNPHFESAMLPALRSYLKNFTDRDTEIEFKREWREGVAKYLEDHMLKLISSSLNDYNWDMGCYENENPGFKKEASIWAA